MENIELNDLLEREEQKAKERIEKEKAAQNGGGDDIAMGEDYVQFQPEPREGRIAVDFDTANDPLRLDRPAFVSGPNDPNGKNRYNDDREENDETGVRRSRDRGDDDTANGASDKDSANGSGRNRQHGNRSRSPGRPGSRGSGYRNRSHDRTDRYRGGGRRGSDDDRYYRPPPGDRRIHSRERGGGRDYGRYGGGRRRSPPQGGGRKRKTPEPTDDERDRRTVFVQQLAARLRSYKLIEYFEQAAGPVVDAQVVKDRVSGRSKGVGYVEFRDEESVQKAISLTGQKLLGIPIIVQVTEAEKNRMAKTSEGGATQSNGIPFHRLYVGNIHFSITEDDLKNVFEPFGELEFVQLQKEEQGRSKGYGFVQFIDPGQAKEALEKMNGFELAGRPIRVGLGNDRFTPESTQSLLQRFGNQAQGSSFSGMGGRGAHAGGTGNFDRPTGRDHDKTGGASALDDTDVGGVNFNNYSRDALMRKLARIDEPEQKTTGKAAQQKKAAIIEPTPTRCVIIKNAYDQNEETDLNWKQELKEEVFEECNAKYGKVVHLDLALDNDDGEIYVKFENVDGAKAAILGLNGRYFGARQLTAQYVVDAVYNMNFPKALKV